MGDLAIVLRSLRARLFSTTTTTLTVGVAVALLLVMLGARDASRSAFARGSGNMHLLVSRDSSAMVAVLNGVFFAGAPQRAIEWEVFESIGAGFPWEYLVPTQIGDSYRGRPVVATTGAFFERFRPVVGQEWVFAEGRAFERPFEVVVGADAARATGLRVGDVIALTHGAVGMSGQTGDNIAGPAVIGHVHREYPFTVVGILAATGGPHDRALFTDLIGSWVLHAHDRRVVEMGEGIPLATPDDLVEADRLITGMYGRLATRPGRDASAVIQQVFDELRRDPTITVASPAAQIAQLFAIVSNVEVILIGMAVVVLATSGITIMIALYGSMEQRRRQIAIMRVLGCSRRRVVSLVVTESAMIGLMGGVCGVVVGQIGSLVVAEVLRSRLGIVIEPWIPLEWLMLALCATIALAALAGATPAVLGYRVAVVRRLRPSA
ncbi:MAG: ABC transporter permease [Phycisphaerales bacterium]